MRPKLREPLPRCCFGPTHARGHAGPVRRKRTLGSFVGGTCRQLLDQPVRKVQPSVGRLALGVAQVQASELKVDVLPPNPPRFVDPGSRSCQECNEICCRAPLPSCAGIASGMDFPVLAIWRPPVVTDPLSFHFTSPRDRKALVDAIAALLVLGVIGTGVAYVINYRIISDDGPVLASTVTYLLPVVAIILGALVLAEPITVQLAAGVAIVLAGVALTRRKRATAQPDQPIRTAESGSK